MHTLKKKKRERERERKRKEKKEKEYKKAVYSCKTGWAQIRPPV